MPKLSYAQIAQKSKDTSANDVANSADRCATADFDDLSMPMTTAPARDAAQAQPSSSSSEQPRPQRGSTAAGDSRPTHAHSHGRQRGTSHAASASDDAHHHDYNGVASVARPLP